MQISSPLILICSDFYQRGGVSFHRIHEQYLHAALTIKGAVCVFCPAYKEGYDLAPLIDKADGLLLTGARSNVEPHHYHNHGSCPPSDPRRDSTNFSLIKNALNKTMPILGICRGLQEINVALGGSLQHNIHTRPHNLEHYDAARTGSYHDAYRLRHKVFLEENGILAQKLPQKEFMVNSLHRQAIDKLGNGLTIEAKAEDGIIEAVSLKEGGFCLGLQWHPEYFIDSDPVSQKIFQLFAEAIYNYHQNKNQ